jgi:hypothetical protein
MQGSRIKISSESAVSHKSLFNPGEIADGLKRDFSRAALIIQGRYSYTSFHKKQLFIRVVFEKFVDIQNQSHYIATRLQELH